MSHQKPDKLYTTKQMGDACEMLVAAELTLAGVPALKVPDSWPGYDVVAQPEVGEPLRVSVKSRTWNEGSARVRFNMSDVFDWLAIVLVFPPRARRVFVIPRQVALARFKPADELGRRAIRADKVTSTFPEYEDNFRLEVCGKLSEASD